MDNDQYLKDQVKNFILPSLCIEYNKKAKIYEHWHKKVDKQINIVQQAQYNGQFDNQQQIYLDRITRRLQEESLEYGNVQIDIGNCQYVPVELRHLYQFSDMVQQFGRDKDSHRRCSICKFSIIHCRVLTCGHEFCVGCIQHLVEIYDDSCPDCRQPIVYHEDEDEYFQNHEMPENFRDADY